MPPRPLVLLSLDTCRPGDPRTGLGTASIAAALAAADVPVTVIAVPAADARRDLVPVLRKVNRALVAAGPDALLGMGVFVWNEPEVRRIAREVGHEVVLGGPQVTFAPRDTLATSYPGASWFVRGAGEEPLRALACRERLPASVHRSGDVDRGAVQRTPLTNLPSPHLGGQLKPGLHVRWETQRGCVFACSFCQHREPGRRRPLTLANEARLRSELAWFEANGVRRVSVLDPVFHQKPGHAEAVLGLAREVGLKASLSLQCRFELLRESFLDAGEGLALELEFGLQTVVSEEFLAVGRPNRLDRVEDAIRRLHARNLWFEVSLIYGLPGQTLESFRHSVRWCLNRGVPSCLVPLIPIPRRGVHPPMRDPMDQPPTGSSTWDRAPPAGA